jgi:hypothetical protein
MAGLATALQNRLDVFVKRNGRAGGEHHGTGDQQR